MSSASTTPTELAVERFLLTCWRCRTTFDALAAAFCGCLASDRTLVCPGCRKCSCAAPVVFRRKFWMGAPPALRARKLLEHNPAGEEPVNLASALREKHLGKLRSIAGSGCATPFVSLRSSTTSPIPSAWRMAKWK